MVFGKKKSKSGASIFGEIDDIAAKFNTSRDGETHTKVVGELYKFVTVRNDKGANKFMSIL
jgi:hypothetical protein